MSYDAWKTTDPSDVDHCSHGRYGPDCEECREDAEAAEESRIREHRLPRETEGRVADDAEDCPF